MTDKIHEALAELVALEDLKKSLAQANHHAARFPTDENYTVIDSLSSELARRRPLAWSAARAALSAPVEAQAVGWKPSDSGYAPGLQSRRAAISAAKPQAEPARTDRGDRAYTLRNFGDVMTVQQGPYDHWHAMLTATPASAAAPVLSDEQILSVATELFPCWREDIQPQFVLRVARAILTTKAAAPSLNAWVPVSERLPEGGVDVLVSDGRSVGIDRYDEYNWSEEWAWQSSYTHWMPLPSSLNAPKE